MMGYNVHINYLTYLIIIIVYESIFTIIGIYVNDNKGDSFLLHEFLCP